MKKVVIIPLAIVILVGLLIFTRRSAEAPPSTNQTVVEQVETPQNKTTTNQSPGHYVDYAPDTIGKTTGTKLLFFHAPWCPQCRQLEADIKSSGVPNDVTIIKVDYDSNQSLRKQYGVTIQTTLVRIDDQGKLIKRYVAYDSPTVAAVKQNLLD
jgi:thiol-disulfide isomerase/thioredoxin